jgi:hypothetical protein
MHFSWTQAEKSSKSSPISCLTESNIATICLPDGGLENQVGRLLDRHCDLGLVPEVPRRGGRAHHLPEDGGARRAVPLHLEQGERPDAGPEHVDVEAEAERPVRVGAEGRAKAQAGRVAGPPGEGGVDIGVPA